MLIHFKKMQSIKKTVLFFISVIIVQPLFGMIMEQYEYTVKSNTVGIEVSFGGQTLTINKAAIKIKVIAPYSSTLDFVFPENKENTYSVSRENLPGDLDIRIVRVGQGLYTIFLLSRKTFGEEIRHIDVH
jgi:hypothetical protein